MVVYGIVSQKPKSIISSAVIRVLCQSTISYIGSILRRPINQRNLYLCVNLFDCLIFADITLQIRLQAAAQSAMQASVASLQQSTRLGASADVAHFLQKPLAALQQARASSLDDLPAACESVQQAVCGLSSGGHLLTSCGLGDLMLLPAQPQLQAGCSTLGSGLKFRIIRKHKTRVSKTSGNAPNFRSCARFLLSDNIS
jgi:hypothetical protein